MSTLAINPATTLRSLALAQPATIRVFECFNLDYCCGGARPLALACAEKQLDVNQVLAALEQSLADEASEPDLSGAGAAGIIAHIVATHHAYVRAELPRLLPMAEKVARKHGPRHPEAVRVEQDLRKLAADLTFHLEKEERMLFPYVEAVELFLAGKGAAPHSCFATVESPIRQMIAEHEGAGELLAAMREVTDGFAAPADACPTSVGLYHGLDAFERDLHRHVHLENNLLFPLALRLEQAAAQRRA